MMTFLEALQPCQRWPKSCKMCVRLRWTDVSKQEASTLVDGSSLLPFMRATSDKRKASSIHFYRKGNANDHLITLHSHIYPVENKEHLQIFYAFNSTDGYESLMAGRISKRIRRHAKPVLRLVERRRYLVLLTANHVKVGSAIIANELQAYRNALPLLGYTHFTVHHSVSWPKRHTYPAYRGHLENSQGKCVAT